MKARKNNLVKAVASVVVLLLPMASSAQPSLVILVRHAERAAEPADDPGLSEAGRSRATALLRSLEGSDISAIISSHYRRTRETAAPLATQHGIDVQIMAPGPAGIAAHVAEVAAAVRQQQGQVLVQRVLVVDREIVLVVDVDDQRDVHCPARLGKVLTDL